jgi:hypothetical protein
MADFTKDVIRIIMEHKCTFVRHGNGDHDRWYSPITGKNFTVDGSIKKRHTANAILKSAGIGKRF